MHEDFLIDYLKKVNHLGFGIEGNKQNVIRSLMNITLSNDLSNEFYTKQDQYLQDLLSKKTIIDVNNFKDQISLYLGDITTIKADAIVNAANSLLLGCFVPLHKCIDNAIHSYAGLEVRRDCFKIMTEQNSEEKSGDCKVTLAYNLPSKYIFHTVGPIVDNSVTKKNEKDLKNCYLSCLKKADEMKLFSLVFCSIATGEYGYPILEASKIAIDTVKEYLKETNSSLKVISNLFSRKDYYIYESNLSKNS